MTKKKFITKATAEKVAKKAKSYTDSKVQASNINFEKLATANTYRFTKGTGAGQTTMDIDIEKDKIRAIVGFVTITETDGKYYDGANEVGAAAGVTKAGIYLKSNELDAEGNETGVEKYADASAVIEYLTLGDQTGKVVTLAITANNKITADIADKAIAKGKLDSGVQDSLNLADSALQDEDVEDATETEVEGWFGDGE